MSRPQDIRYTRTHEWARVEGDIVIVGITDYAVQQLGGIALIDLPRIGTPAVAGGSFGGIESTKTDESLLSPICGQIIQVNTELEKNADIISKSPFGDGWMIKIRPSNPKELDALLDAGAYEQHVQSKKAH